MPISPSTPRRISTVHPRSLPIRLYVFRENTISAQYIETLACSHTPAKPAHPETNKVPLLGSTFACTCIRIRQIGVLAYGYGVVKYGWSGGGSNLTVLNVCTRSRYISHEGFVCPPSFRFSIGPFRV
ncbi:unnamed protein product [Aphis gossypii]|uniref:Uncharacterized protein n=1 Tax=Aphis gossypii TaxID=80765 RepID=A0A9P0J4D4_APHGO|nr:unnamed protein product [Aphis gossypii]